MQNNIIDMIWLMVINDWDELYCFEDLIYILALAWPHSLSHGTSIP